MLVGLSLVRLPLARSSRRYRISLPLLGLNAGFHIRLPSLPKLLCEIVGFLYPFITLLAILATANHFVLDAVAGGAICLFALQCNQIMTNLLPLEDCVFWCFRIHKPVHHTHEQEEQADDKFWSTGLQ